jgi:hypothetical protein
MPSDKYESSSSVSRRKFFAGAGVFFAGAAVAATGCSLLPSSKKAAAVNPVTTWPLPYKKLDPEIIRKRSYAAYYKGK